MGIFPGAARLVVDVRQTVPTPLARPGCRSHALSPAAPRRYGGAWRVEVAEPLTPLITRFCPAAHDLLTEFRYPAELMRRKNNRVLLALGSITLAIATLGCGRTTPASTGSGARPATPQQAGTAVARSGYSSTCAHPPVPLPSGENVTVSGHQLMAGDRPFVVHGAIIEGLQDSPAALAALQRQKGTAYANVEAAQRAFGSAELKALRCMGVNTLRIHVGQPSADPESALYSKSYLEHFATDVRLARAQGLAVIVDMNDERHSGETHQAGNPTMATVRAWQAVVPMLANVPGVMFEAFNEPLLEPSVPGAWRIWLNGGMAPGPHSQGLFQTVGVQQLVDTIRAGGARNPIILMGLLHAGNEGWTLAGMPPVADPIHQLAFAIHFPFTGGPISKDEPKWNRAFGDAAQSVPVLVTAFNVNSSVHCGPDTATTLPWFVDNYLPAHGVGLVAWAADWPGTIFQRTYTGPLTTLSHFTCQKGSQDHRLGDGELLYNDFTTGG